MLAAREVLFQAKYRIITPTGHLCCGRPLYDFGMLDMAKRYLLKVLDALGPELEKGTAVVVLEPSCASVFRAELCNLLPRDPRCGATAGSDVLLSEFLVRFAPEYQPRRAGREDGGAWALPPPGDVWAWRTR